jgi:hypothetical protein
MAWIEVDDPFKDTISAPKAVDPTAPVPPPYRPELSAPPEGLPTALPAALLGRDVADAGAPPPAESGPRWREVEDPYAEKPAPLSFAGMIAEAGRAGLAQGLQSVTDAPTAFSEPTGDRAKVNPQAQELLETPISKGWHNPAWIAAQMTHGLAASAPSLATGFAGGAIGSAYGPGGQLAGSALGFGLGSALQTVAPAYQKARAEGLDHDAAVSRAMQETGIAGAFGAAMGAAPGLALFGKSGEALKRPLGEALAQVFGVQPALSVAQQAAIKINEGKGLPTAEEAAQTALIGAATGAVLVGGHRLGAAAIDQLRASGIEPTPINFEGRPHEPGRAPAGEPAPEGLPPPEGQAAPTAETPAQARLKPPTRAEDLPIMPDEQALPPVPQDQGPADRLPGAPGEARRPTLNGSPTPESAAPTVEEAAHMAQMQAAAGRMFPRGGINEINAYRENAGTIGAAPANDVFSLPREGAPNAGIPSEAVPSNGAAKQSYGAAVPEGQRTAYGAPPEGGRADAGRRGVAGAETVNIPGHSGVVTAEKPEGGRTDRRTYRIYPEGLKFNRLQSPTKQHGEPLGYATLSRHPDGRWQVDDVDTSAAPGQGLAQKLYDSIEQHLGAPIEPSGFLTKDGYQKLWQNRRPEAVKDHRWSKYHGHYLSPLQIKQALTLVDANLATPGLNLKSAWAKELPKERAALQAAWDSLPQDAKDRATPDQMFSLAPEEPKAAPLVAAKEAPGRSAPPPAPVMRGNAMVTRLTDKEGKPFLLRLSEDGEDLRVDIHEDIPGKIEDLPTQERAYKTPLGGVDLNFKGVGQYKTHGHRMPLYEVGMVEITPKRRNGQSWRRRGVATAMYNALENMLGMRMSPSGTLLDDGYAYWKNRNPEAVAGHRKLDPEDDRYLSPKQINEGRLSNKRELKTYDIEEQAQRNFKSRSKSAKRILDSYAKAMGVDRSILENSEPQELKDILRSTDWREALGYSFDRQEYDAGKKESMINAKAAMLRRHALNAKDKSPTADDYQQARDVHKMLKDELAQQERAWRSIPKEHKTPKKLDAMFSLAGGKAPMAPMGAFERLASLRGFYSPAGRAIETFPQDVATVGQWSALLAPGKIPGVTKDWRDYVDIDGALKQLADEKGKVSKAALKAYVDAADVDLDLVTLRGPDAPPEENDYQEPNNSAWEEDRRDELDSSFDISKARSMAQVTAAVSPDEMISALTDNNHIWELLEENGFADASGNMEKAPTLEDMHKMGFTVDIVKSDAFPRLDYINPVVIAHEKYENAIVFSTNPSSYSVEADQYHYQNEALDAAQKLHDEAANEVIDMERPDDIPEGAQGINDFSSVGTKFHEYIIPGARYMAEILVKPKHLIGRYTSKHFETHEIIHQRLGEVDLPPLPGQTKPRKGLLIEETQSDAHALGEDRGYETLAQREAAKQAFQKAADRRAEARKAPLEAIRKLDDAYNYNNGALYERMMENVMAKEEHMRKRVAPMFQGDYGGLVRIMEERAGTGKPVEIPTPQEFNIERFGKRNVDKWAPHEEQYSTWVATEFLSCIPERQFKIMAKILKKRVEAYDALNKVEAEFPVPELPTDKMLNIPYKGGLWLDLGLKLALRHAVENGYDTIVLPKARMIGDAVGAPRISELDWSAVDNNIVLTPKDKNGEPFTDDKTEKAQTIELKGDPQGGHTAALAFIAKKFGAPAAESVRYDLAMGRMNPLQAIPIESHASAWETAAPGELHGRVQKEAMPEGGAANLGMQLQYEDRTPAFFAKYTAKWGGKVTEEPIHDLGDKLTSDDFEAATRDAMRGDAPQHILDELDDAAGESRWGYPDKAYRGLSAEAKAFVDRQLKPAPVLKTIDITPQMREAILGGQPLYNKRGGEAQLDGYWSRRQRTIGIALSAADPMRVFHEESAHAMGPNGLDLLSPQQNALLRQTAVKENWIEKYIGEADSARYRAAYRHAPDVEGLILQEAIDHAYADYAVNRDAAAVPKEAAAAFDRVREFFKRTKKALVNRGAENVGDIFGGMYSGDVGGRYRDPELIRFHDLLPVAGGMAGAPSGRIDFADLTPEQAPVIGQGVRITFADLIPRRATR